MQKLLSVVIPTYNRSNMLIMLLERVLPILPDWADMVVLDNASKDNDRVKTRFENELLDKKFTLVSNKFNVGGDENILRCFEHAQGQWVWTLGDDDEVYLDAFEKISAAIEKFRDSNTFYIHFNWEEGKVYKNEKPISSFTDLFSSVHSLGDLNFISSGIFKVDAVKSFIYWSHFYQCSGTPVTSLILQGLNSEIGSIVLSNEQIVINGFYSPEKDTETVWDVELVLRGLSVLPDYPFSKQNKDFIINYLDKNYSVWLAAKSAVREHLKGKQVSECIRSYHEILRVKLIYGNVFLKIWISIIALFLRVFIKPMAKLLTYLKGKGKRF